MIKTGLVMGDIFGSGKRGRPSFIEDKVTVYLDIDRWLLEDIDLLIKIDRKVYGKVSRNWYIRNILQGYCGGRGEHLAIAREALRKAKEEKVSGV